MGMNRRSFLMSVVGAAGSMSGLPMARQMAVGEIGTYEGFRFVEPTLTVEKLLRAKEILESDAVDHRGRGIWIATTPSRYRELLSGRGA